MATGPPPKPPGKGVGHGRQAKANEVKPVTITGGAVPAPKLPDRRRLKAQTRRWWDTWVGSPQATLFGATEWERLLQLVPLVDEYWHEPRVTILSEIRLNEERIGALPMDRLRLRWVIEPEATDAKPTGKAWGDARLRAVGDEDEQ